MLLNPLLVKVSEQATLGAAAEAWLVAVDAGHVLGLGADTAGGAGATFVAGIAGPVDTEVCKGGIAAEGVDRDEAAECVELVVAVEDGGTVEGAGVAAEGVGDVDRMGPAGYVELAAAVEGAGCVDVAAVAAVSAEDVEGVGCTEPAVAESAE